MTVKQVFEFLNSLFPTDTACDFDNVGLLVGNENSEVSKALLSLDCTLDTVKAAVSKGCELIITHHPVIFEPLKTVLKGSIVYELITQNISVISMHTNMDMGKGGVNDRLCEAIGISQYEPVYSADRFVLKGGNIEPVSAEKLAETLKSCLGGSIKFTDSGKQIKRVLVCSGSGGEFLGDAISGGFDALVTADVKHHEFLNAYHNNISLFDAGHFNTEDIVLEPLAEKLRNQFSSIDFLVDHSTKIEYK